MIKLSNRKLAKNTAMSLAIAGVMLPVSTFAQGALEEIQEYEIVIFSRWGDYVFRSTDPYSAWNGKFKNQQMGEGVYVWIIKVKFFGIAEEFVLSNDLTLFR